MCKFLGRKRKAIVKGNSVMEFGSKKGETAVEFGNNHSKQGTEGSFLGVGLMSKLFTDYWTIYLNNGEVIFCDYISFHISIFCWTGDVKTRTLSKKRKKNKTKIGGYAVIAAKNADAFTKAREPKRIDSVADPDDDDANEEDIAPSTSIKKNDWDIVSLRLE